MRIRRWMFLSALTGIACGGLVDPDSASDASTSIEAALGTRDARGAVDVVNVVDSSPAEDAGLDDANEEADCTMPKEQEVMGSDGLECKIGFGWTCGANQYFVSTMCVPFPDASLPSGFTVSCMQNGIVTGPVKISADASSCSCADASWAFPAGEKVCAYPL